jgi:predicted  nucleic acid-binding Zn-ribbon protein
MNTNTEANLRRQVEHAVNLNIHYQKEIRELKKSIKELRAELYEYQKEIHRRNREGLT